MIDNFLGRYHYPALEPQNTYETMYVLGEKLKLSVIMERLGVAHSTIMTLVNSIFKNTPLTGRSDHYHNSEYDVVATALAWSFAQRR
jgi:hypothetical protein